jgi:hypothetical protein
MKYFALFLNAFFLFLSSQVAIAADSITYKIDREYAKFYIPIEPQDSYRRFKPETPNGGLEYAIALNIGSSQAGHFLYKFPGATEVKASLPDLLTRGRRSVWISENGMESVSDQHSVDVFYSRPYIVISITNPKTLKLLEGRDQVTIFIRGFKTSAKSLIVKIDQ